MSGDLVDLYIDWIKDDLGDKAKDYVLIGMTVGGDGDVTAFIPKTLIKRRNDKERFISVPRQFAMQRGLLNAKYSSVSVPCYQCGGPGPLSPRSRCVVCEFNRAEFNAKENDELRAQLAELTEEKSNVS